MLPEYVMLPDMVGSANCFSNVCGADAGSRLELILAITTKLNGESASVNGTVMLAVNELMEWVAPDTIVLSDAFRTSTEVTTPLPDATA